MARPLRIEYPGAFYHVTSRGNEKGKIFTTDRNREKFLHYIETAHKRFKVVVHAYCLMPNHYHLLIETPLANLCRCMQWINSSYTTYYNIIQQRTGHLFQGRYKAILIDKDSYMAELSRYVHLNPVRAKIVKLPEDYQWSSYRYFIYPQQPPDFLHVRFTLDFFNKSKKAYRKFVEEGISGKVENPLKAMKANLILGDDEFVEDIQERYLKDTEKSRDLPSLREINKHTITPERIVKIIRKKKNINEDERDRLSIYFLRKYTGETLKEILMRVVNKKLSISAVSKIAIRMDKNRKKDTRLDKKIKKIEVSLSNV